MYASHQPPATTAIENNLSHKKVKSLENKGTKTLAYISSDVLINKKNTSIFESPDVRPEVFLARSRAASTKCHN